MNKLMILALVASSVTVINAEELQSFMGIRFGMKISEGNFSGPDEKGDYTFLPPGAKANPKVQYYVSPTQRSKRVWKVAVNQTFDVGQGDFARSQYLKIMKRDYGAKWECIKPEREEWRELYATLEAAAPNTVRKDDLFLFCFRNSQGDVCQVMQMIVIRGEDDVTVSIWVMDVKLSQLDDKETSTKGDEQKKGGKMQTPDSFLGYMFGSDIKQCAKIYYGKREDGSCVDGNGCLKKPFRKFTGGRNPEYAVRLEGCVTSRRLYKISVMSVDFPQDVSKEDVLIEFRATRDVIAKKYGVPYKERVDDDDMGIGMEMMTCEAMFEVGKVRILLRLECLFGMRHMWLEATNEEIEHDAKKEIEDSLRVAGDGMDAL